MVTLYALCKVLPIILALPMPRPIQKRPAHIWMISKAVAWMIAPMV
jgi:hypothetical protein